MFTFVIEIEDAETGDIFHNTSPVPVQSHNGNQIIRTLGIGTVESGHIKPVDKSKIDVAGIVDFLKAAQHLLTCRANTAVTA